jgi:tartronate-semialdehyde synthase
MRAAEAAIHVLEQEGVTAVFGVPGAAINPFYAAMRKRNSLKHALARQVKGASHIAEGYTRAAPGNIGVCVGTSGPAGTDMVTGLYSAWADSIQSCALSAKRRAAHSSAAADRATEAARRPHHHARARLARA